MFKVCQRRLPLEILENFKDLNPYVLCVID